MSDLPQLPERYVGVRLLGEGATGSVYEAYDRLAERRVALKIVRPNLAIHARFRARFAHEVALSARVVHPRVVPVHDYGRLGDNRPFVSLAYADRGSFDDLLEKQPPLNEALRLVDQVLEALAFLHARGFLHQDLKPGNVLLYRGAGGRTDAWVADLGVTEALSALAMDRRGIAGTPGWMAPEQLMGRAQELGPWTDLYAVGLMLYGMLGGNIRAEGAEEARGDLLKQRLQLKVKLRAEVPRALGEVVANLLDPEPRQRYDRAADVRRALNHAVSVMPAMLGNQGIHRTKFRRSTTSFAHTFLPEGRAHFVAPQIAGERPAEIRWNRVAVDPMPHPVPPEPGLDSPARASLNLVALRDPPMVGRHEVRQRLWTLARDVVRTGAPQVALVIGEAGTGKSRVVSSVVEALDQHGYMETITLRYHNPPGPDDGYRGAVRELLMPYNDTRPELEERLTRWLARDWGLPRDAVADESAQLARWCGMLRDGESPIHAASGLAYLYRYLDARGWRGGAALVLEDAHFAQASGDGLAICEALLRRTVGERPVLAIATLSADALANNPALAGVVEDLLMLGAQRVDVSPLASEEIQRLLTDAYLLDPPLAAAVAPRCFGSPSFATLLIRDWAARRYLVQRRDGFFELSVSTRLATALPSDLDALCRSRVQGALASAEDPAGAGEALAATTLAGQDPPTLVVRTVSPGGLDALLATGLVRQRGWRLAYEYGEVQRAAASVIQQSGTLADLHKRLADAWQGLGRRTGADVDLQHGLHRLHADQPELAFEPLLKAARTSLVEGRAALALDAARLAAHASDRAGTVADKVEARVQQAEAMLELERYDDVIQAVSQARKAGKLTDRQSARLQVLLARAALHQGAVEQADRLLDLADATLNAARDREGLAASGLARATLYRGLGYWQHAVTWYQQVLALQPTDPRVVMEALKDLIESRIASGLMDGLNQDVTRLRQVAAATGDTRTLAHATYASGRVHLLGGQLDEAERHFRTSQALAATLGADPLVFLSQAHLGEVFRTRQQDGAAADFFAAAARFAEEHGWVDEAATTRLSLALVSLRGNEERRAYLEVDRASQLLHDQPQHWAWALIGLLRGLAAARLRDPRAAAAWWQVARERGLDRVRGSPELWHALQRLAHEASTLGLHDISAEALALASVPTSAAVMLHAEPDEDDDEGEIIELPAHAGRPRHSHPEPSRPPSGDKRMSPPPNDKPPRVQATFLPEDEETTERHRVARTATFLPEDDTAAQRALLDEEDAPPTRRRGFVPTSGPSPTAKGAAATFIPDDVPPARAATSTFIPEDIEVTDEVDDVPKRRKRA